MEEKKKKEMALMVGVDGVGWIREIRLGQRPPKRDSPPCQYTELELRWEEQ